MTVLKGGRGKKAPWQDAHIRVPVPIKEDIQQQINEWKAEQIGGENTEKKNPLTGNELRRIRDKVLKQKKSASKSFEMFFSELGIED